MTDSKFIKHIPCDNCGSKDANSLYEDSHTYCFSCETYVAGDGTTTNTKVVKPMNKDIQFYDNASSLSIANRGITSATCIAYGVRQDKGKHYYPYFDGDGVMSAVKTRDVERSRGLGDVYKRQVSK